MTSVMIIEDDAEFAEILSETLQADGSARIVTVETNEQDARRFMDSAEFASVECAIIDLRIPQTPQSSEVSSLSGLRLVQQLRHAYHFGGTIIVLTNSREFCDGERALAAGCDAYLCKHGPMSEWPRMFAELRMAMRGEVVLVSREMRHVFIREELSIKEAHLMELLAAGHSWSSIARQLGYKTAKAAANVGYRAFDKLITPADRKLLSDDGEHKRTKALERWRASLGEQPRQRAPMHMDASSYAAPHCTEQI